jgi:hypothetical protein
MNKIKKKILFSIFMYSFVLLLLFGPTAVQAQASSGFDQTLLTSDISLQNNNFDSFRVDYTGMTILDDVGNPVIRNGAAITTKDQTWIDPLYQFPKVQVSFSQAFLTTPTYSEIPESEKQAYLSRYEPTNKMEVSNVDTGKVYYLKQYTLAFDVGLQTFTNFNPNKQFYDIMLSPLDGFSHDHDNRGDRDAFDLGGGSSTTSEPNVEGSWNTGLNIGTYDTNTGTLKEYPMGSASRIEIDTEPMGVIGGWVGTGANPWQVYWLNQPSSPCAMRNSLEPLGDNRWGGNKWEYTGLYTSSTQTGGSSGGAITGLTVKTIANTRPAFLSAQAQAPNSNGKWDYGNRNSIIKPTFKVTALSEFIQGFDYTVTKYIDNVKVEIKMHTTSAKIGIYNAIDAGNTFKLMGTVKNQFNQQEVTDKYHSVVPNPANGETKGTTNAEPNLLPQTTSTNKPGWTSYILESSFTQVPVSDTTRNPEIIQGTTQPDPFTETLPDVNTININTFSTTVPTTFNATGRFQMAPVTTVNWAQYNLIAQYQFHDSIGLSGTQFTEDVKGAVTYNTQYPYKINIDNVYGVRRMGFKVAVLTENSAEVVVANGRPIKIEDFTEFNYNSLGTLVDNYLKGKLDITEFSWDQFFADIFASPLTWILIIGVIAIFIVFFMLRIRRRPSPGGLVSTVGGPMARP